MCCAARADGGDPLKGPASVLAILGETEPFAEVIEWLRRRGLTVTVATRGEDGLQLHRSEGADLVLLGLPLGDCTGSAITGGIRQRDEVTPIVVVGGDADIGSQLEATAFGAQAYVAHPVRGGKDLLFALGVALGARRSDTQLRVLHARDRATTDGREIVGSCPVMKDVKRRLRELCERTLSGAAPMVLLLGEIGTGKALIAKTLHYNGARRDRPFVGINCAALSAERLRHELFGEGSGLARAGLLEAADGGTIFLDEVGAAPLDVQRDLLTAIDDKLIRRGEREPIHIDVQFVAATRRDLGSMVKRGEFRADLYHRLNVIAIDVPPLRERGDDVLAIAELLLVRIAAEHGIRAPTMSSEALAALRRHSWPGNIRELRNELERIVLLVDDDVIRADHLRVRRDTAAVEISGDGAGLEVVMAGDRCPLEQLEREVIRQALVRSNGNISRAARYLAITRQTLLYRMKKYDFRSPSTSSEIAVERSSQ